MKKVNYGIYNGEIDIEGDRMIKYIKNNIINNQDLLIYEKEKDIFENKIYITINKKYVYPVPLNILSLDDTINLISNNSFNMNSTNTLCEILSQYVRVFFDLENIPEDKPDIIYEMINDFIKYCKADKLQYNNDDKIIITQNLNSKHKGLSYHIYLPIMMNIDELRKLQLLFNVKYNKYCKYIDNIVYHKYRFFRCPGQIEPTLTNTYYEKILQNNKINNKFSYHKFIKIGTINNSEIIYNDYKDEDLKICIKNSLIQNFKDLNYIKLNNKLFDVKELKKNKQNYEYYLRVFSKNVNEACREYHDLIKIHQIKNDKIFKEYLNVNVELIIIRKPKSLTGYIADIKHKFRFNCDDPLYDIKEMKDTLKIDSYYYDDNDNYFIFKDIYNNIYVFKNNKYFGYDKIKIKNIDDIVDFDKFIKIKNIDNIDNIDNFIDNFIPV